LLPYGFLLEYNLIVKMQAQAVVLLPYGFLLEYNHSTLKQPAP